MDYLATIDGNSSLIETERACEIEQDAGFQLDSIQFGTLMHDGSVFLVNKAAFNVKVTGRLKNLSFVEVNNGNPQQIKQENVAAGWTFICDSQIYVTNHVKRVLVFGKKNFS